MKFGGRFVVVLAVLGTSSVKAFAPKSREELKEAVNAWVRDPEEARATYGGAIGEWDVSEVNDMSYMFCGWDVWCSCGDLCENF